MQQCQQLPNMLMPPMPWPTVIDIQPAPLAHMNNLEINFDHQLRLQAMANTM